MKDFPKAAPSFRFQIGRYRFGRYSAFDWEIDDGCTGTSGYKTPVGAFIRLLKIKKKYKISPLLPVE
jgi:hypothetical protein